MANKDTIRETFDISSSVQGSGFLAGVELEVESIKDCGPMPAGWAVETDGSLRNEGREFISPPLGRDSLVTHFKLIHKNLRHYSAYPKFSERTSIHVHVNMLNLTQEQTKSVLFWYAVFEPIFFAMVAHNRRNNIHCVGLDQTIVNESYKRTLPVLTGRWSKYTALNLLPLKSQGTIEFRHMEGHDDAEKFAEWLGVIERLWAYGQTNILKATHLEPEELLKAFDAIFGGTSVQPLKELVLTLIEDNVMDIKLALFN
jgi:hypothetical protein